MGVTKQAAQKRFVAKESDPPTWTPTRVSAGSPPRQERGDGRSQRGRAAGNDQVGPAHLTLGLLAEPEGLACKVLFAQGFTAEQVREAVAAVLPPAAGDVPELIPYDAEAKKALELTFREALRLGHNYVGTEHVLLALLEHEDGDGPLTGLGVDKAAVEAKVTAMIAVITMSNG